MSYNPKTNDICCFYNAICMNKSLNVSFANVEKSLATENFNMVVNEMRTDKLKVHVIQMDIFHDFNLNIEVDHIADNVVLHFVCEGQTEYHIKNNDLCVMRQNTNNLFYLNRNRNLANHFFRKDSVNQYFKVYMPYSYIDSITDGSLKETIDLISFSNENCQLLSNRNIQTTIEMKLVMNQIKNAPYMGNVAPMYFEAKIRELLALQFQQVDKLNNLGLKDITVCPKQLYEARNLIEHNFQNPPSIRELAQLVGMSETVLKTGFKKHFGITIYGYLFDYRMAIAQKMLHDCSLTIAEIAFQTGYENPSHFTTAFKRKYGLTPFAYRVNRH